MTEDCDLDCAYAAQYPAYEILKAAHQFELAGNPLKRLYLKIVVRFIEKLAHTMHHRNYHLKIEIGAGQREWRDWSESEIGELP